MLDEKFKRYNDCCVSSRARGGSSYADSMFRMYSSSDNYAKTIFDRLIRKFGNELNFQMFTSGSYFLIAKDDKPVLIKDYFFVESKRCESVHAFEEWLKEILV